MKDSFLLILLMLLLSTGVSQAQSTVSFGYDAAGNRINRVIVLNQLRSAQEEETVEEIFYSEVLKDLEIRIYPNPTEGLLKVDIQNLPEQQTADIFLYNLSGKLLITKKGVSESTDIDLTGHPAGTYLMKIIAGEQHTEWKIIKK